MKILFALDKYRTSDGGADRLARAVVTALTNAKQQVRVMDVGTSTSPSCPTTTAENIRSYPLPHPRWLRDTDLTTLRWNRLWQPLVAAEIRAFTPDLILTQNMLAPATVFAAQEAHLPVNILFHGYRCLAPDFFRGRDALTAPRPRFLNVPFKTKLKWPAAAATLALYRQAYTQADAVIANSNYAAQVIERFFQRPAAVLYPLVDLTPETITNTPRLVPPPPSAPLLFVKPQPIKGVELFTAIAQAMPEKRFIVAGQVARKAKRAFAKMSNVECRGWVTDMDALYDEAALILAPSRIPEPFGRVFVEAGLHNLPAIATKAGGIPEAVGAGGTLIPMAAGVSAWVEAIRHALTPEVYPTLAETARAHAAELCRTHDARRLGEIVLG